MELGICGKAARGRNFLHEVKTGLSNSSSSGGWEGRHGAVGLTVLAEPGALPAVALGPQVLPRAEKQHPGGATVCLDEFLHLSEPHFPHRHRGRAAVPAWWGCSEIQRGHVCPAGVGFFIAVWGCRWPGLRSDRP